MLIVGIPAYFTRFSQFLAFTALCLYLLYFHYFLSVTRLDLCASTGGVRNDDIGWGVAIYKASCLLTG
jgi:hypothetical protein